jgi:tRNA dimethylallyltransferase
MSNKVLSIVGPTGVGKSNLALWLARQCKDLGQSIEIISMDSALVYQGMDIGTAKPSPDELQAVPHHLIDVSVASEPMDITRDITLARAAVESITARGRKVLVTGGSGFYLKSFFAPVADEVAVPAELISSTSAVLILIQWPMILTRLSFTK